LWMRMPTVSGPNEPSLDVLAEPEVRLSLTPRSGPIVIEIEYRVDPVKARLFYAVMQHVQLRARLEIQMASLFRAILRMRRKARANWSQASEDSIVASKSFDSRLARFIHPNVLSTTHLLGKTMKPLTVVSVRLTTVMDIRLAS